MFHCRNIRWLVALLALLVTAGVFASEAIAKQHKHKTPKYLHSPHCQVHQRGLIGVTNAEKAFNFFLHKGLTPNQSAGIVGNLLQETSDVSPTRTNYLGAFGIGQWLYGRKTGLFNFAKSKKESPYNLKTQLQYIWYELTHTETQAGRALKSSQTLYGATIVIRAYYERPASWEANDPRRYSNAQAVFAQGAAVNFCGRWKYHAPAPHKQHAAPPTKHPKKHKKKSQIVQILSNPAGALIGASRQGLKLVAIDFIEQAQQSRTMQILLLATLFFLYLWARNIYRSVFRPQPKKT